MAPATEQSQTSILTRRHWVPVLIWTNLIVGVLLVGWAYGWAGSHSNGDQLHFALFWVGMLAFVAPLFLRLCAVGTSRNERLGLVVLLGLFSFWPKFLRNPLGPLYHDELFHWREAQDIYRTGRLFLPNPVVHIIQFFPGLGGLTVALRDFTGLSTFQVGSAILLVVHVAALIGVFVIAEELSGSARISAIAAFVYFLNPSYMYFDTQYGYESLAIVFFIWVVACTVKLQTAGGLPQKLAWFASALLLAFATIITHHVTSYIMCGLLLLMAFFVVIQAIRRREKVSNAALTAMLAMIAAGSTAAWLFLVSPDVISYLAPYLGGGVNELVGLLQSSAQSRRLFAKSIIPPYELYSALIAPLITGVAALYALRSFRKSWLRRPVALALSLFGVAYFASVPFVFTPSGAEGAQRSWAFTYLGLSVLIAPAVIWAYDARGRFLARPGGPPFVRRAAKQIKSHSTPRTLGAAFAVMACVVLVGNTAAHMDAEYRFPGPFLYGSDVRDLTPELLGMSSWFRYTEGTNQRVFTDRYSGLALGSLADEWTAAPSPKFPAWDLLFYRFLPPKHLLETLRYSHYKYMIIDNNMARFLPLRGIYFEPDEPLSFRRTRPVPWYALTKYQRIPWTIKVYGSPDFDIYRFDYSALNDIWAPPNPAVKARAR
ncbi:MAG TPA: hypothetical protein VG815_01505 [Chloroflexota bacterium]|nr:hypothetical protein [Chloroflexota bacterium]